MQGSKKKLEYQMLGQLTMIFIVDLMLEVRNIIITVH